MKIRKIEIISDLAHFKKPYSTKTQNTYSIPPISTVLGIIKNLFGEDKLRFIFGYTFTANENSFKDIQKIYKEVNFNAGKEKERFNKDGIWVSDIGEIHYLINPKLTIYISLKEKMIISEPLNLGKTDCLARVAHDQYICLEDIEGEGFNQFTPLEIEGIGKPMNLTIETLYNGNKGYYDIYKKHVRLNQSFKYNKHYDKDDNQNIFLWEYKGSGKIDEFR